MYIQIFYGNTDARHNPHAATLIDLTGQQSGGDSRHAVSRRHTRRDRTHVKPASSKLSPAVVSMNRTFPSMNTQPKSTGDDFRTAASNGTKDVHSTSKQQRQPVRRSQPRAALFPTTATELVPSSSIAARGRSPSGVKRGPPRKFEPAKSEHVDIDPSFSRHTPTRFLAHQAREENRVHTSVIYFSYLSIG